MFSYPDIKHTFTFYFYFLTSESIWSLLCSMVVDVSSHALFYIVALFKACLEETILPHWLVMFPLQIEYAYSFLYKLGFTSEIPTTET
jgi:hypothetical protein